MHIIYIFLSQGLHGLKLRVNLLSNKINTLQVVLSVFYIHKKCVVRRIFTPSLTSFAFPCDDMLRLLPSIGSSLSGLLAYPM
jgi:hypothetical protein